MRARPSRERGAALLTVLLLVAIVGALAAMTLEKLNLATRQGANANAMMQARAWADAATTMALVRIDAVLGTDRSRVSLAGGWSDRPFPLPIPRGTATARVRDGGNCFNLNSLVTPDGRGGRATQPLAVAQFARLLKPDRRKRRRRHRGGGGRLDRQRRRGQSRRRGGRNVHGPLAAVPRANAIMVDVTELRAVAGVTPDAFAKLRPYVCALPTTDPATINVNTLEPERAELVAAMAAGRVGRSGPRGAARATATRLGERQRFLEPRPADERRRTGGGRHERGDALVHGAERYRDRPHHAASAALVDARQPAARIVARSWGENE